MVSQLRRLLDDQVEAVEGPKAWVLERVLPIWTGFTSARVAHVAPFVHALVPVGVRRWEERPARVLHMLEAIAGLVPVLDDPRAPTVAGMISWLVDPDAVRQRRLTLLRKALRTGVKKDVREDAFELLGEQAYAIEELVLLFRALDMLIADVGPSAFGDI
jgi:hypothetical protein